MKHIKIIGKSQPLIHDIGKAQPYVDPILVGKVLQSTSKTEFDEAMKQLHIQVNTPDSRQLYSDSLEQSDDECKIVINNNSAILIPTYPKPCTYVRIVNGNNDEVAYWDENEWREDPSGVMGAIMGCLKSMIDGKSIEPCDECDGIRAPLENHRNYCSLHKANIE